MKLEEMGREMLVYLKMENWGMETKKEVGKEMEGMGKANGRKGGQKNKEEFKALMGYTSPSVAH